VSSAPNENGRNWAQREFARRLRTLRQRAGYTQGKLADKIGVIRTTVVNMESGRWGVDFWNAVKLRRALRCTWNELMP